MALTRPRLGQLTTGVASLGDPLTVLHAGSSSANVDVGFLFNRANGLVSNVALYWNEAGNAFVTSFTSNSGTTDSNITVTSYANIVTGSHTVYGPILPAANVTYDLGSPTQRFRTLYISGNTIDMGGALISSGTSGVTITHNSGSSFQLAAAGQQATTSNATGSFGNIVVSSGVTSTSTSTGALQVTGGAGIGGNLYVGGNLVVNGTQTFLDTETVLATEYVRTINATNLYASTIGNAGATLTGATLTTSGIAVLNGNVVAASGTSSSSTTTGALVVTGGLGVSGSAYIGSVYDSGTRVVSTSSGAGNLSISGTGINLTASGPGVTTVGSSTAIPIITTDSYGRVSALSTASITTTLSTAGTSGTGTVSLANQSLTFAGTYGVTATASNQTITIATPQDLQTTSKPTFANATISQSLVLAGNVYVGGTPGLNGQVLSSTGTGLQWTSAGGFNGGTITGALTISNATDSTSAGSGALIVSGGVGIAGNVYIGGTLTVANLQARGSSQLVVQDPMTYFQSNVLYPWVYDTGLYSDSIGGPANTYVHHGVVRSVTSGTWGFFSNVKSEPDANINWSDAGLIWDKVKAGELVLANSTASTSTTTGALQVAGGAGVAGAMYAGSVYDNGNRVLTSLSSSGAGNVTVSVSAPAGTTISLPATGPGATTVGSASAIPIITTDAYGRISALSTASVSSTLNLSGTSGVGSVNLTSANLTFAGTNGVTATVSGSTVTIAEPQNLQTSASPTFAGLTVSGNITALSVAGTSTRGGKAMVTNYTGATAPANPQQGDEWWYTTGNILYKYINDGSTSNWINVTSSLYNASTSATASTLALRDTGGNLTATNFLGVASSAKYADLAEIYVSDETYEPGTVVVFGGEKEITVTDQSHDARVAGVISTNPAYLMNSECAGLPVAFTGRVPCRVQGPVTKGQLLVTSTTLGVAQAIDNNQFVPGCVVGKSLENITTNEIATIEVVVGRF